VAQLTPSLYAYAYRTVRQADEAADLVQDTWISALRTLPGFQGRSSLRTWLVSILRRRIADRYRRARPTEELTEGRFQSNEESVEQRLGNSEAARAIRNALPSLAPLERGAVELCDVQELDRDSASVELGVTRGHLRVLLHRGRQKLQRLLVAQGIEAAG